MRRRIGHLLLHYPAPGGTTTAVLGLCRAMARLGWEALIYCCPGNGRSEAQEESEGVRVVQFSNAGWNPFRVDRRLLARLSRNQDDIDLLMIHGMFSPANVAIARMARDARIPYVIWLHGVYTPGQLRKNRMWKILYGALFERPLLNGAVAVRILAAEHAEYLADYGVRVPTFVVPNGFDPEEVPPIYRHEVGLARGEGPTLNFLFLGRLDMRCKGLDLLLKAFSAGIHDGKLPANIRLDLVGADWGDQHKLEALARRLGISELVRFQGYTPPAGRWSVLSSHDVLVLPSRWDGFPLAVLEAMVAAKPVIVSEEACVSSFVRDAQCGYIVEPNPGSISAGLVRAIGTRDQWPDMGERGRRFAYQHLTWDKIAQCAVPSLEGFLDRSRTIG